MCVQNLKFVALHVPEITGVLKIFGQSLDTPTLPFLQNVSWAFQPFLRMDPVNVPAKFEVRIALPVPGTIAIEVLGGVANPQSWGRRGPRP